MATVGKLVVELAASTAKFQADLGRAAAAADANSRRIGAAMSYARGAVGALAGALSVAAIASWTREMVQAAEDLQDLSEATGSTVESLSRLQNIAKVDGAEFEKFKGAIERLAAGMAGAEEGSSKTAEALRFLGVTATDPAQALEEIAKKLDTFADGAGKAALAKDLFGKSGVSFISTLKQIANAGDVAASVTTAQAAEASRLAEAYRTLGVASDRVKNEIAGSLIPVLADLVEQFKYARENSTGFFDALYTFGTLAGPVDKIRDIGKEIRVLTTEMERLQVEQGKLKPGDRYYEDSKSLFSDAISETNRKREFAKFLQRQQAERLISPANDDANDRLAKFKPDPRYRSSSAKEAKGPKDDPAKKLLEGQLRAIEAYADAERDVLRTRQEYLDRYFGDGAIGIREYFAAKQEAQEADLAVTKDGIDRQIVELQRYRSERGRSQVEIADTDNKITDLQAKREKAERDAGKASVLLWFDANRAAQDYKRSVEEVAIRLLELEGKSSEAAAARRQAQNAALRRAAGQQGDVATLDSLDREERLLQARDALTKKSSEYAAVLDVIAAAQTRIGILREAGALTELEALRKLSEVNREQLVQLKERLTVLQKIAAETGDPAALDAVDQMRLRMEALAATGDLVAKKFNEIGASAFSDALQSLAMREKSFKEAAIDFGKSISGSITRVVADNLSQKAFGKDGIFSGFGDIFSSLFGGGKDAGGAVALTGSASALNLSASALSAAAAQLSAASGLSVGGNLFGSLGSFTKFLPGVTDMVPPVFGVPGFEMGTDYVPRTGLALVHKGERITPAAENRVGSSRVERSSPPVNITINMPAGSTASPRQIAQASGDAVARALKRR